VRKGELCGARERKRNRSVTKEWSDGAMEETAPGRREKTEGIRDACSTRL